MAKVTITTDSGEVVEVLTNSDLPVSGGRLAMQSLADDVWEAVQVARKKESAQ